MQQHANRRWRILRRDGQRASVESGAFKKKRPREGGLCNVVKQLTFTRNKLVGRSTIRIACISIVGPTIGVIASVPSIVSARILVAISRIAVAAATPSTTAPAPSRFRRSWKCHCGRGDGDYSRSSENKFSEFRMHIFPPFLGFFDPTGDRSQSDHGRSLPRFRPRPPGPTSLGGRILRAGRGNRATEKRDKLAPPHYLPLMLRTRHRRPSNLHRGRPRQCPLWVESRNLQCTNPCPLYPQKRTLMDNFGCPLWAKSGHGAHSISSSARRWR
jgi:hypothetical protein